MSGHNIWDDEGFTLESLTAAVNSQPYRPGQISATGIFQEDGVNTTVVSIEYREGKLALVEPTERGGPGETTGDEDRSRIPFEVDHYQRDDSIYADEVQNVRAFGSEDRLEALVERIERKAQRQACRVSRQPAETRKRIQHRLRSQRPGLRACRVVDTASTLHLPRHA